MKKYLSIFLIFFLLFGVSVPAFAATDTPVSPSLDSLGYDSFIVLDAYNYDPFTMESAVPSYVCIAYDSSIWQAFHVPDTVSMAVRFVSYSESPTPIYYSNVIKTSYDSSTGDNGWTFEEINYSEYTINGNTVYGRQFSYSLHSLDYYDSVTGELTHNPILLSNLDIYNGSWSNTTGADITDEVFFSPIPPLVVETEKALTLFQNQTIQTVLTLALCGVGCLALLISLPILRKVLLRFLNK